MAVVVEEVGTFTRSAVVFLHYKKQQTGSKPTKNVHLEANLSSWPPEMGHLWTSTGPKRGGGADSQ